MLSKKFPIAFFIGSGSRKGCLVEVSFTADKTTLFWMNEGCFVILKDVIISR